MVFNNLQRWNTVEFILAVFTMLLTAFETLFTMLALKSSPYKLELLDRISFNINNLTVFAQLFELELSMFYCMPILMDCS